MICLTRMRCWLSWRYNYLDRTNPLPLIVTLVTRLHLRHLLRRLGNQGQPIRFVIHTCFLLQQKLKMHHYHSVKLNIALLCGLAFVAETALAVPIAGRIQATSSLGQLLTMTLKITDETTIFELTGPDYSFFAFGFDTTTMRGYSLIIQGLDDDRTVVEQNLVGIGNSGSPQSNQNLNVLDICHDEHRNLTTLIIERASQTGDSDDPDFSTNMTSLDVIWAYDAFATPENPIGFLSHHGSAGRGSATVLFSPIPEPTSALLAVAGSVLLLIRRL